MTDVCTGSGLPTGLEPGLDSGTTTVTAHGGRVSFDVPLGWNAIERAPGEVVAAVEPDDADRFRTNVVVTVAPVDRPVVEWDLETSRREAAELDGYLLLDRAEVEVGGHPGTRRLTTHSTPAGESVTTASWSTVVDGVGITLTARVATLRVPEMAAVVAAVAASLVVRSDRQAAA
ncbi:hypothetical protein [Terrabacter sp. NPDC080008]|uniref:hypothetical protein n=1 Tax=Terrabacter sp. NPDC080008 TaxID=3155176 RepID=UPI00344DB671